MSSRQKGLTILKKFVCQKRGLVPDQCQYRLGTPSRKGDRKLERKSSQRQSCDTRQLVSVFQDMTLPKSILRKSTDMPKTIQRVKFKNAIARHTKIRNKNPSLGYICPGEPHKRSPNALKFEDRSLEESGKSKVHAKQRGSWPKMFSN